MKLDRLKTFALSLPYTTCVKQWGECLVHKVADKVFFVLVLEGATLAGIIFKCAPDEFDALTAIDGIVQAPYFAKRHWVKLEDVDALPEKEIRARLTHSYDLVVAGLPKKTQAALRLPT